MKTVQGSSAIRIVAWVAALAGCASEPTAVPPPPPAAVVTVATVPVPANYGIHDTYVRDGIAFVCVWNTGVQIYDVGNGMRGGSPSNPVLITTFVPNSDDVPGGPQVHNAWWFHNPALHESRYLFLGQEGPGNIGFSSAGDLHVLDVSDLANPREVSVYSMAGAGVHNFWMDEPAARLYAAYYNGGVVAFDVSGTLPADLSSRVIATAMPGGPSATYVWGVQLADGALWAVDMLSGFWKLDPVTLGTLGGGNNVPDRYGSDLWVAADYGYTGTWGGVGRTGVRGDAIKVWRVSGVGDPALVDSVIFTAINTVSDLQVSDDGAFLAATAEGQTNGGLYLLSLANPAKPVVVSTTLVDRGLHTGTIATIGGRQFVFGAKNPPNPALMIFDVTGVVPSSATGPRSSAAR
ncbi:MAG: hypothetical protein ABI647_16775 [Gemmatimonadota bacterium]